MVSMADPVTRRRPARARIYPCAICGRKLTVAEAVYSRFSGRRFCSPAVGHLKRRKETA